MHSTLLKFRKLKLKKLILVMFQTRIFFVFLGTQAEMFSILTKAVLRRRDETDDSCFKRTKYKDKKIQVEDELILFYFQANHSFTPCLVE